MKLLSSHEKSLQGGNLTLSLNEQSEEGQSSVGN